MAKKISLKEKNAGELVKLLGERREELRKLRFEAAGARPKDSNAPAKVKRDIARIMTELHAKKTA
ncbi:MAG TPA: 50S ribosomal protein L29 [Candidatus Paceibacterota bacterium]|nr:50S ribosomal protein L29 [Candidatus Paceibacterota bacterium]